MCFCSDNSDDKKNPRIIHELSSVYEMQCNRYNKKEQGNGLQLKCLNDAGIITYI